MQAYTHRTHELLAATAPSVACGLVVDLREDTGGNMWPMLGGLKPFLGDAALGAFEGRSGQSPKWVAGQGIFINPPATLKAASAKAAVMTMKTTTMRRLMRITIKLSGKLTVHSSELGTLFKFLQSICSSHSKQ